MFVANFLLKRIRSFIPSTVSAVPHCMVGITFYSSIQWQILVPYQHWSMADHKRGGFLNWHKGMAKHLNIVSLLLCHPMKDSWWVVCFEPVLWSMVPPFLGLENFQGAWILLHKGMARHFTCYPLLPCHPQYTLVYQYPYLFNAKYLPVGGYL